jgi:hypothetical protein
LLGAAERLRQEIGAPLPPSELERYEFAIIACREALPEATFKQEWETGRTLPLDYAIEEAMHVTCELAHPTGTTT